MSCLPNSTQADAFTPPIAIPAGKPVHLRVEVDFERLRFAYRVEGADADWRWLPEAFNASILSDEATVPGLSSFTGALVGMACQDLAGTARPADFDFFEYRERNFQADPTSPPARSPAKPRKSSLPFQRAAARHPAKTNDLT
jgi:xylan 1,4-beta-xylosidase